MVVIQSLVQLLQQVAEVVVEIILKDLEKYLEMEKMEVQVVVEQEFQDNQMAQAEQEIPLL